MPAPPRLKTRARARARHIIIHGARARASWRSLARSLVGKKRRAEASVLSRGLAAFTYAELGSTARSRRAAA